MRALRFRTASADSAPSPCRSASRPNLGVQGRIRNGSNTSTPVVKSIATNSRCPPFSAAPANRPPASTHARRSAPLNEQRATSAHRRTRGRAARLMPRRRSRPAGRAPPPAVRASLRRGFRAGAPATTCRGSKECSARDGAARRAPSASASRGIRPRPPTGPPIAAA